MLFSAPVFAQYGLEISAEKAHYSKNFDTYGVIERGISAILGMLAFVFFGLVLYSGIRWMTARGDESFVERAKDTLRAAVIGLAITLAAYALTLFIFKRLNTNSAPPVTPTSFFKTANVSKIS